MLAISIHQPQASLLAWGFNHTHLRTWATGHRGPLALHASRRMDDWDVEVFHRPGVRAFLKLKGITGPLQLPRGCIIATATLLNCVPTRALFSFGPPWPLSPRDIQANQFRSDTSAWLFGSPRSRRPWPCDGSKGLFTVPLQP